MAEAQHASPAAATATLPIAVVAQALAMSQYADLLSMPIIAREPSAIIRHTVEPHTKVAMFLKQIPVERMAEADAGSVVETIQRLYHNDHPNVASFYNVAFVAHAQSIVIATEWTDRRSLRQCQRAYGALLENGILFIAGSVLAGLAYLHNTRVPHVIHRDIQPSTILVNSDGQIKIGDFGLSSALSHTFAPARTWIGSSQYMAPERICGFPYYSNCDIWSLGVTLVETALGVEHFGEAIHPGDHLDSIVDGPPPSDMLTAHTHFSKEFIDLCSKCCLKNFEERPQARDLLSHPSLTQADQSLVAKWVAPDMPIVPLE